jgi:hypothetical protein
VHQLTISTGEMVELLHAGGHIAQGAGVAGLSGAPEPCGCAFAPGWFFWSETMVLLARNGERSF